MLLLLLRVCFGFLCLKSACAVHSLFLFYKHLGICEISICVEINSTHKSILPFGIILLVLHLAYSSRYSVSCAIKLLISYALKLRLRLRSFPTTYFAGLCIFCMYLLSQNWGLISARFSRRIIDCSSVQEE